MPPHGLSVRYEMKRGMEDHKRESQGLERLDCFCFYFFWGGMVTASCVNYALLIHDMSSQLSFHTCFSETSF